MEAARVAADEEVGHELILGDVGKIAGVIIAAETVSRGHSEQTDVALVANLRNRQDTVVSESEVQTVAIVPMIGVSVVDATLDVYFFAWPDLYQSGPVPSWISRDSVRHIEERSGRLAAN